MSETEHLINTTVRSRETAIGALIADAMRWSAQTEVAITNGGGVPAGQSLFAGRDPHAPRRPGRAARSATGS